MNSDDYQNNLRAEYKIFGCGFDYPKPKKIEKFKGKNLGKVVMDENENLDIVTKTKKQS